MALNDERAPGSKILGSSDAIRNAEAMITVPCEKEAGIILKQLLNENNPLGVVGFVLGQSLRITFHGDPLRRGLKAPRPSEAPEHRPLD